MKLTGVYLSPTGIEIITCKRIACEWMPNYYYYYKFPPFVIGYTGEILDPKFLCSVFLYLKKKKYFPTNRIVLSLGGSKIITGIIKGDNFQKQCHSALDAESIVIIIDSCLRRNDKVYTINETCLKIDYKILDNNTIYFTAIPASIIAILKKILNYARIKLIALESEIVSAQRGFALYKSTAYKPLTNILFLPHKTILTNWSDSGIEEFVEINDNKTDLLPIYHNNLIWYEGDNNILKKDMNSYFMKYLWNLSQNIPPFIKGDLGDFQRAKWNNFIQLSPNPLSLIPSPMAIGSALWQYGHVTIPRFNFLS